MIMQNKNNYQNNRIMQKGSDKENQQLRQELLRWLNREAEPEYAVFSAHLLPPGGPKVLGVRLPKLRNAARKIAHGDWRNFLSWAGTDSFEEIMLQGMVIGAVSLKNPEEAFCLIRAFLPKICNWSLCDSFCSSLKIAEKFPEQTYAFLQPLLESGSGYSLRFAVVMLNDYFLKEPYLDEVLQKLCCLQSHEPYVQMAQAWAFCSCWPVAPEKIRVLLERKSIPEPVFGMTVRKLLDSRRVSVSQKQWLRCIK